MPCTELFDKQTLEYKLSLFPVGIPVLSLEASATNGWSKYAHASFGLESFGVSAPGADLFNYFGFTEENLVTQSRTIIEYYKQLGGAQSLMTIPKLIKSIAH